MRNSINPDIVCCYLYVISKHGYPPPAEDSREHLQAMHAMGFTSVELEGIRAEHLTAMYDLRQDIKQTLSELGMQVPVFCTVLPGLSSPDEKTRNKNLALLEKGCEVAKVIGAGAVLDNAPLPPYLFPGDIPVTRHYGEKELSQAFLPADFSWAAYWDVLTSTFRTVCEICAGYGLTYQIHPALGVLVASTDSFLNFYHAVRRDNLRFNLDTANQYFLKENLVLALHKAINYIDYIHLSDNSGTRVEHLEPGEGTIEWSRFFETLDSLNYSGQIGIDVGGAESGVRDLDMAYTNSAFWIREHWNKIT